MDFDTLKQVSDFLKVIVDAHIWDLRKIGLSYCSREAAKTLLYYIYD